MVGKSPVAIALRNAKSLDRISAACTRRWAILLHESDEYALPDLQLLGVALARHLQSDAVNQYQHAGLHDCKHESKHQDHPAAEVAKLHRSSYEMLKSIVRAIIAADEKASARPDAAGE